VVLPSIMTSFSLFWIGILSTDLDCLRLLRYLIWGLFGFVCSLLGCSVSLSVGFSLFFLPLNWLRHLASCENHHDCWFDEKHLNFLSINLGLVFIFYFVIVTRCFVIHVDKFMNLFLPSLSFLNLEFQLNYSPLKINRKPGWRPLLFCRFYLDCILPGSIQ
jgi:hypothetical protein